MKLAIFRFSLLCLLLWGMLGMACAQSVDVYSSSAFLRLKVPHATYVIHRPLDLQGNTCSLPAGVTLQFTVQGSLRNGRLIGHHTSVVAPAQKIFGSDLLLSGSWKNDEVLGAWCLVAGEEVDATADFQNLMTLCNGVGLTHLYTDKQTYWVSAIFNSAPICVPSHTIWHNLSTIRMKPSSLEWYNIVLLRQVEDVTIDGGVFIGDVRTHQGTEGEWGHGIKLSGASHIELRNLVCKECWGDGIDLLDAYDAHRHPIHPCRNVRIENVRCLYNRRQGLSIEAAHQVDVLHSEFAYTGKLAKTAPSAGIDIEPWNTEGIKIQGIRIVDCQIHHNEGADFLCMSNMLLKENYEKVDNQIQLIQTTFGKGVTWETNGLCLRNCVVSDKLELNNSSNIELFDCTIHTLERSNCRGKYRKVRCSFTKEIQW